MSVAEQKETEANEVAAPEANENAAIRIILADSQAIYRVGMRKVFALEDDIRVVAQAETLQNLYAALHRFPTDVVFLEGALISGTVDAIPETGSPGTGGEADCAGERGRRIEYGGALPARGSRGGATVHFAGPADQVRAQDCGW